MVTQSLESLGGSLEQYMVTFGDALHHNALTSLAPLHVPGQDQPYEFDLLRTPYEPQAHVITAGVKQLRRAKSALICGEMGTGKTLVGMATIHELGRRMFTRPYRTIVYCPGQLVLKWEREILETIPGAKVIQIRSWTDLTKINVRAKATCPEYYILARDRGKLGSGWTSATISRSSDTEVDFHEVNGQLVQRRIPSKALRCPNCGRVVLNDKGKLLTSTALKRNMLKCVRVRLPGERGELIDSLGEADGCGAPLYTYTAKVHRWAPADFIKRKMHKFFDFLILDEIHEMKGDGGVAQANAAAKLFSVCKKMVGLTGTLLGGKAEDLRCILMRYVPHSMVRDGFDWTTSMPFNERYGRIETKITEATEGSDNRMSMGRSSRTQTKSVKPGIMPTLFGKHVLENAIFIGLDEMSDDLPALTEETIAVDLDEDFREAYQLVSGALTATNQQMVASGDRRLMGAMLQCLRAYPDHPYHFGEVGYWDTDRKTGTRTLFHPVVNCPDFPEDRIYAKEQALIDYVKQEKAHGRQCWVYVQFTGKRDVAGRLHRLLSQAGLTTKVLRSDTVKVEDREKWIYQNGKDADVIISHPKIVETGLDLFDRKGNHNFATLIFYETGYNAFTLRQAARRAWRISQYLDCKVVYMYYKNTAQEGEMALMGRKIEAATAIEGKFSSSGLLAMLGDDEGSDELALARSLSEQVDRSVIQRNWGKMTTPGRKTPTAPPPQPTKTQVIDGMVAEVVTDLPTRPAPKPQRTPAPTPKPKPAPKPALAGAGSADSINWNDVLAMMKTW